MPGTDSTNPSDWYAKAKEQFEAALLLRSDLPTMSLVHVQQAAEILLKGKLLEKGVNPGQIHSVDALQKKLKATGFNFTPVADPALLDESYFKARYPTPHYVSPPPAALDAAVAEVRRLGEKLSPTHFPRIQDQPAASHGVAPPDVLSDDALKALHEGLNKASEIQKKGLGENPKRPDDTPKK